MLRYQKGGLLEERRCMKTRRITTPDLSLDIVSGERLEHKSNLKARHEHTTPLKASREPLGTLLEDSGAEKILLSVFVNDLDAS